MKPLRLSLLAGAMIAVLAACGSTTTSNPAADPSTADVTVTSTDMVFDSDTITVAAGESFTVALVNEDAMPHNIAIYTDESASEALFVGDMVTDGTITYEIDALEAGEYFFRCDLHPEMTGTIVVEG
ncbi:MAG: cupredoxin domain-containing protein [Candidatus Limnocylindria bacterium]